MISLPWVQAMAAYNAEMNRRLYRAAEQLDDTARHAERGAFFGSIHGTLCHLVWGDTVWMHRFDGWERPPTGIPGSPGWISGWEDLKARRAAADAGISAWAAGLTPAALEGELSWFSGATSQEMKRPRWLLITHMFNHQTHHRGQVHAMITAAGAAVEDTDLPWVVGPEDWGG